jgi:hypothetical protein
MDRVQELMLIASERIRLGTISKNRNTLGESRGCCK